MTKPRRKRAGLSLVELVISMGLLSLMMLPVIALMATSYKVASASTTSRDSAYARHVALEVAALRLQYADQVVATGSNFIDVRLPTGTGRLSYAGGRLNWRFGSLNEVLAQGLSNARFSVGAAPGANPEAGELLLIELGTRPTGAPTEVWSSTQIWIKPTI
ncbi:MAG: prepilin-type N-terminal cleavage/methylation domain-containing protein [Pirellulaceae bacterium]